MRRRSGLDIPETLEDACDPATMALIVYDMQVGVLRQLPDGGAEAVERVSQVLTAARAGGYPVFFTRHMSLPVRLMGTAQLRSAMAWQQADSPEKVQSWFLRGGRDRPAMRRALDDFRFSGDALLTDTATITPLLTPGESRR